MFTSDGRHVLTHLQFRSIRRTCWVCFGAERDEPGLEWTSPCKCRGATKWVHQDCLQPWIDQKQLGSSTIEVSCPQCQHPYDIVYPTSNPLLYLYEYGNRAITFLSPVILASLTASSLYWVSFTFGVTSASLALGKDRSIEFFSKPESSLVVVALPILPWVVLGVKLLRLEVVSLRVWYSLVLPAFKMIRNLLPVGKSDLPVQQRRFVPAPVPVIPFLARSIVGTFLLPLYSSAIGWGLSYMLRSGGTLKRTILVRSMYNVQNSFCLVPGAHEHCMYYSTLELLLGQIQP